MTSIQEKYNKSLKPEISAFIKEVNEKLKENLEIKEYCKGWRVFYSPLIKNPDIMFIGINPGNGQEGVEHVEDDIEKLEYLEYWCEKTKKYVESVYPLARETKKVFNLAQKAKLLETAVKTNFFFISTSQEKDIYKITTFLGRDKGQLGERVFDNASKWTKELIELIQPKIIICEGKIAYQNVTELYSEFGESQDWENECAYVKIPNHNLLIIGYARYQSRIKNKPELAKILEQFAK